MSTPTIPSGAAPLPGEADDPRPGDERADALLARTEAHFRRLIENTSDIIQVFGPDGRIQYTSPSIEWVLGYSAEELAGREAPEFVHPDDVAEVAATLRRDLEAPGSTGKMTFRLRHKDGSWRTCDVIARSATDENGRTVLIVNTRDVTAQKEAEAALAEREAELRGLLSGLRAIVWECDPVTWEFRYISQGVEDILGYPVEDWYSDADLWADTIHPEDRSWVVEACAAGIAAGRDSDLEYRVLARDGRLVWLRDIIHVVTDEVGAARTVQGIMVDITEKKGLEDQLRQAQKMEAVGRLAGGIAHDFNNVLTAIEGYAELVLAGLDQEHPARGDAEEIKRSAEHAASLTRQLLAFSRRQHVRPVRLDLNDHVRGLLGMLSRLIGVNHEIHIDLDPELGAVEADPSQVEQVVVNLVVNAKDAMPAGGPIGIATRNLEITEAAAARFPFPMRLGEYVLLSISDQGPGIPPEVRPRIFEPFFTTKEIGRGTGLGLSTVYGILKQAGGFIHADAGPEGGTVFEVYLPRVGQGR